MAETSGRPDPAPKGHLTFTCTPQQSKLTYTNTSPHPYKPNLPHILHKHKISKIFQNVWDLVWQGRDKCTCLARPAQGLGSFPSSS